ncbi:MAG TPA: 7-cyano-7-deazaguanine synthase, partial [Candidatus Coatesbacteria bacterium]|nr:7-cyano-7-deazaguanine synthase [Candidatus Coatesbacteria bacterium]
AALWVDYGQLAAEGERSAAEKQAGRLGVTLRRTKIDLYRDLPETGALFEQGFEEEADARRLWVPARNAVLFSLGAAAAESLGLTHVAAGLNADEAVDFPDNSVSFLAAADRFLFLATAGRVQALSPTVQWSKAEIVAGLLRLGLPLDETYSCYRPPDEGGRMCGRCPSCRRLREALAANGVELSGRFSR